HHKERGNSIVMATRFHSDNEVGTAAAYAFLGKIDYVSHRGEKPIQFEWALHRPMPKKVFVDGRTVASEILDFSSVIAANSSHPFSLDVLSIGNDVRCEFLKGETPLKWTWPFTTSTGDDSTGRIT